MLATSRRLRPRAAGLLLVPALLAAGLAGCSDDSSEAAGEPSETPTASTSSASPSGTTSSPSATAPSEPERPSAPAFAPGEQGQKAFAEYVVASWGYALSTNDATALTGLSPSRKEQCRGCKELATELRSRAKERWHVEFPGATVERTTLAREGERILATTVADIPASRSYFEDGTFRNDNEAHAGAKFLIDLRIDGQGKKRHYVLLAFSLR